VAGGDIIIYPGWPTSANLTQDLAAGKSHVTLFPKNEERNTTRYPERNHLIAAPVQLVGLSIVGSSITVGKYDPAGDYDASGVIWDAPGTFDADSNPAYALPGVQNLALRINGKFYVHQAQAGDTLAAIATALAALVAVDIAGTSASGSVITVGSAGRIQAARVGGFGTIAKELRRQERVVQISVWANTPPLRDTITSAVDVRLAATKFLDMPDGFGARLIYKNTLVVDTLQKALVYRRDLNYLVEYATTISQQRAAVIAPSANLNAEFAITA
jgi:hypothetical protein